VNWGKASYCEGDLCTTEARRKAEEIWAWGKGEPSTFILVISGKVKIRNPDLPSLKGGKSFILRSKLDLRV
jgi:hypothetical protein